MPESYLKLKVLRSLIKISYVGYSDEPFIKRELLKILHLLFLKNVVTSKSSTRVVSQSFKIFLFELQNKKNVLAKLNSALFDMSYAHTLIINNLYEAIDTSHEFEVD